MGEQPDESVNILEATLLFSSISRHHVNLDPYRRHIMFMQRDIERYLCGLNAALCIEYFQEALSQIIHKRYGYVGKNVPPQKLSYNNLTHVIDSRIGSPLTLGILYTGLGQLQGWNVVGIDFPVHMLIRIHGSGNQLLIDPIAGGRTLSSQNLREKLRTYYGLHHRLQPQHYQELTNREILLRLQKQLIASLLRENKICDAVFLTECTQLFAPNEHDLWRQLASLYVQLNDIVKAIAALEQFLKKSISKEALQYTSIQIKELRSRLS